MSQDKKEETIHSYLLCVMAYVFVLVWQEINFVTVALDNSRQELLSLMLHSGNSKVISLQQTT